MDGYHVINEDGTYGGMDVEYLNALCNYITWDIEYVECTTWEDALEKLAKKEVDLVGSAQYSAERAKIYDYADIFHCEPIEKVADDFIIRNEIIQGNFDVISKCKYAVPDYWDIGEVFERLIEDNYAEKDVLLGINEVYTSWIADKIVNFNSDLYYQSREYLSACYREGKVLTA